MSDVEEIKSRSKIFEDVIMCGYPGKVGSLNNNNAFIFDIVMFNKETGNYDIQIDSCYKSKDNYKAMI